MSEALKALEEVMDVLCRHLGPQVLNQDIASDIDIDRHDDFRNEMREVAADILALPTLRAALSPAPVVDGEIEARQRFANTVWDALKGDHNDLRRQQIIVRAAEVLHDALAAELAAERERGERMREALASFVDRTWMKCLSNDLSPNHLISMDVRVSDLRRARAALEGGA